MDITYFLCSDYEIKEMSKATDSEKMICYIVFAMSLTLVSFESTSLVENSCQIWTLYLSLFKVIVKAEVNNC